MIEPRPLLPVPEQFSSSDYARTGEMLMHGIREPRIDVSHRMPLSTISAALLAHHSGLPSGTLRSRLGSALIGAAALAGGILQPWGALVPLAAAATAYPLLDASLLTTFPELVFSILLLLTAGLLVWRAQAPSWRRTLPLALAIGASFLCRSVLVFFPPLLLLFEGVFYHRASPRSWPRSWWRQAAILCIVPYLFLAPWVKMNKVLHQRFVPFEHGAANFNIATGVMGLVQASGGSPQALVDTTHDVDKGGYVLRWAAGEILRHPLRYLDGYARRLWFVLSMQPYLYFFAFLSLCVFWKRRDYHQVGLLMLYYTLIYCTMSVMERYMRPLWPVLALLSASLVGFPWGRVPPPPEASFPRRLSALLLTMGLGFASAACLYAGWTVNAYANKAAAAPQQSDGEDYTDAVRRYPQDPWLRMDGGKYKLMHGRADLAIEDFAQAALLQPENPEPVLLGAWAQALVGRPAALLTWSFVDDEHDPDNLYLNIHARVYKAYALLDSGRAKEAREHLSKAWETVHAMATGGRHPGQAPSASDLEVHRRLRRHDRHFTTIAFVLLDYVPVEKKLRLVGELAKLAPDSSTVLVEQASLALAAGRRDQALSILSRIEKLEPDANDRLRLATIYRIADDPGRAAGLLKPLVAQRPDLQVDLAEVSVQAKDIGTALGLLKKAADETRSADGTRRIAGVYLKLDQPRRAVELLKALTRQSPKQAGYWIDLAEAAGKADDLPLASQALARARELPLGAADRHRLALVHQERREFKAALELLDPLIQEHPSAKYLNDRGVCLYLNGNADAAIEDFRLAIKLDPTLLSAYSSLGTIFTARQRNPDALQVYDLALARNPRSRSDPQMETILRARKAVVAAAGN